MNKTPLSAIISLKSSFIVYKWGGNINSDNTGAKEILKAESKSEEFQILKSENSKLKENWKLIEEGENVEQKVKTREGQV